MAGVLSIVLVLVVVLPTLFLATAAVVCAMFGAALSPVEGSRQ